MLYDFHISKFIFLRECKVNSLKGVAAQFLEDLLEEGDELNIS